MFDHILIALLLSLLTWLPLAWKWQLGVLRMAVLITILALLAGLLVAFLGGGALAINVALRSVLSWFITLIAVVAFLAYRFYRDPERVAPNHHGTIVSPADGKIIYVREVRGGILPVSTKYGTDYPLQELTKTPFYSDDALVVGIGMSFLDVHVNRAPITGKIAFHRHFPGKFGSLRQPEMVFENERATTVIEGDDLQVALVQIASRLVRQIVAFIHVDEDVVLGQRTGMIRFGSQVDLVLPKRQDIKLIVKPGDRVLAGQSIIGTFESSGRREDEIKPIT
jgi:phosphatidylserine decarboxylase